MWEWLKRNEKNPAIGCVCWPIFTAIMVDRTNIFGGLFGAFWVGVSVTRLLENFDKYIKDLKQ